MIRKLAKLLIIVCMLFLALAAGVLIYVHYNKTRILSELIQEAAKRVHGRISVRKMDVSLFENFPRISILLRDVEVNDTIHQHFEESIFSSKKVYVGLRWGSILTGDVEVNNIEISDGNILLFTDSTGYTNKYLLNGGGGNKGKAKKVKHIPQISIRNTTFSIKDLLRNKDHEYLINQMQFEQQGDSDLVLKGIMDVTVHKMIFNPSRGSFLAGKIIKGLFKVGIKNRVLSFDKLALAIDDQPFRVTGSFSLDTIAPQFRLELFTPAVEYAKVKGMLPVKLATSLSLVNVDKPLSAYAIIDGYLKSGLPLVKIWWKVTDAGLETPLQNFEHATFKGMFTDELVAGQTRDDPNSGIELVDFSAQWKGLPVHSQKISLLNLYNPLLTCDLSSALPLSELNQVAGISSFDFLKGGAKISLRYKGPLLISQRQSELNGSISITGGQISYVPRNVIMNNVEGDIEFNNSNVNLNGFRFTVSGQTFEMNANARNLISLLDTDPSAAVVDFKMSTRSADVGSLFFLLKNKAKAVHHTGRKFNSTFSKIDDILEKGRLNVVLNAGKLIYKNFSASNVKADVSVLSNQYIINSVKLDHAGGSAELSGAMKNESGHYTTNINFSIREVDVEKLFYSFDNFGQDGILSSNLRGILTVNANAIVQLDSTGKVKPGSINSTVNFLLKNGRLVNFEPIKKMQKFIFKNRDFEDISFADLKNTLFIRQQEIVLNKMEIRSSVFKLYVEGIYSQAGNSDLSIQVPLSNLSKKRTSLLNPSKEKNGNNIFLRGRPGKDGKIEFKLDLFNKYQRTHS